MVIPLLLAVVVVVMVIAINGSGGSGGLGLNGPDGPANEVPPTPPEPVNPPDSPGGPTSARQVCEDVSREFQALSDSGRTLAEFLTTTRRSVLSAAAETDRPAERVVLNSLGVYFALLQDPTTVDTTLQTAKAAFLAASAEARIGSCVVLSDVLPSGTGR